MYNVMWIKTFGIVKQPVLLLDSKEYFNIVLDFNGLMNKTMEKN